MVRHFQYRVEMFFKEIVVDGSLQKTKYFGIHVEFQRRGSPLIHSFLWIVNAATLSKDKKEQYFLTM